MMRWQSSGQSCINPSIWVPSLKEIPVIFYNLRPELLAASWQHSSLKFSALLAQRIANPYLMLVAQCSIPVHGSRNALGFAAPYTDAIALKFRINLSWRDGLGYALAAAVLLAGGAHALAKDPIPLPRPRPPGANASPMIPLP